MPEYPEIDDLLDKWEELLERGERLSFETFVARLCPDANPQMLETLRAKMAALEAMNQFLGRNLNPDEAARETRSKADSSDMRSTSVRLKPGAEPVSGYILVSCLGEGGFGEVWKAFGPGGFHVALKFVRMDRPAAQQELRAIEITKALRHPNLLTTFGTWQKEGWLIIAAELAGPSLSDRLRTLINEGQAGIPKRELLSYMTDVAKAIDHLNKRRHPLGEGKKRGGIQHRDIKPQNLLLSGGGVKVADFGIARFLERHATSHTGTMSVAYAAPEFFEGETSDRSDQYSLAVTYCELRGGRLPFEGTKIELMRGHLEKAPDLSMLPEHERPMVLRALAKHPEDRWPSCREFVKALRKSAVVPISSGEADATEPSKHRRANPKSWFKWIHRITAFTLVLGLLTWDGLQILRNGSSVTSPTPNNGNVASMAPDHTDNSASDPTRTRNVKLQVEGGTESPPDALSATISTESSSADSPAIAEESRPSSSASRSERKTTVSATERETSQGESPDETNRRPDQTRSAISIATEILTSAQWAWTSPARMGSTVNSSYSEAGPFVTGDGRILLFTSNRPGGRGEWDLWMSERVSMSAPWGRPINLGNVVNSPWNEGDPCLSRDGLTLLFHSHNRPGGLGSSDIWMSTRPDRDSAWRKPVNLGRPLNTKAAEQSPSLSADGLTLYFTSGRENGFGQSDIWKSERENLDSNWSEPVNLGLALNTPDTQGYPEISSDGLTLLFAGHQNGLNSPHVLWMATRPSLDQPFGHRMSMGRTLNDFATSGSPTITDDGRYMIFHSNYRGSKAWDLWWTQRLPK